MYVLLWFYYISALKDFGKYSKQLDNVYKSESESPSTSDRSLIVPKAEHPEIHSPIPESCLTPRGSDVGVTADMSSEARVILHEINAMQEVSNGRLLLCIHVILYWITISINTAVGVARILPQ